MDAAILFDNGRSGGLSGSAWMVHVKGAIGASTEVV
jgi:hypothetical protein